LPPVLTKTFRTAAGLASSASGWLCCPCRIPRGALRAPRNLLSAFCHRPPALWLNLPFALRWLTRLGGPRTRWLGLPCYIGAPQSTMRSCASDDKKDILPTSGMQQTVEAYALLHHRIAHVVPATHRCNEGCYLTPRFSDVRMYQDSNQFHAVALDADPPILYLNDVSRAIIAIICGRKG
jgi:hypothetical protein